MRDLVISYFRVHDSVVPGFGGFVVIVFMYLLLLEDSFFLFMLSQLHYILLNLVDLCLYVGLPSSGELGAITIFSGFLSRDTKRCMCNARKVKTSNKQIAKSIKQREMRDCSY